MKGKVILSWSSGKDSALAFYELQKTDDYEITALLTTISEDYDRISMHGVRRTLLKLQAESLGINLEMVLLSKDQTETGYESLMRKVLTKYLENGVVGVGFGDIFLEDIRKRRQDNLSKIGMEGLFPLWKSDTAELAEKFVDLGFKAIITCVDSKVLDKKWIGKNIDKQFLAELDSNVDPCGENGEFHSFVYDGPIFKKKIPFVKGDVVFRENRFYYCDLIPQGKANG